MKNHKVVDRAGIAKRVYEDDPIIEKKEEKVYTEIVLLTRSVGGQLGGRGETRGTYLLSGDNANGIREEFVGFDGTGHGFWNVLPLLFFHSFLAFYTFKF